MSNARQEALDAMDRPGATLMMAPWELDALLDTIPASVLARLAVERGGLVEWAPCGFCGDEGSCPPKHECMPVYRITEAAPDA